MYTGKVFTVKLRHHNHACSDKMGVSKGLDKHNMPRFGDVMVPPPLITKVSWVRLLRTSLCTAFIQGTRAAAAAPSSNVELLGLSAEWGRGGGVRGGGELRLQRVVVGLFLRLWTSLRPCRLSSQQSSLYAWMVPQIQFIDRVLQPPVWWRVATVQTLQKTDEIPQVLFLVC